MDAIEEKYNSLGRRLSGEEEDADSTLKDVSDEEINSQTVGYLSSFWKKHNPDVKHEVKQRIVSRTLRQIVKEPSNARTMRLWYAAVAILAISFGLSLIWNISKMGASSEMVQYATAYGEVKDIVLPDGTAVKLNSGSTLVLQKGFEGEKRQIVLLGEAYFDVTKDESKPFEISTSHLTLSVLGTEFNLKAYPEDAEIKAVLDEGRVRLDGDFNQLQSVFMNPGQEAILNKESGEINIRDLADGQIGKWKDGQIVLYNNTLSEIAVMLERKFDVKIVIMDDEVKDYRFSGDFSDAQLFELLGYLSAARNFTFKALGEYVVITK
ncbi:FecR family protein [Carboxylicivirga sp. RSCT41]|uniref:FecR family protein n=1 Tax=Carboxylicivirga agarovorans TaxID=3417570 RepID=UPI003D328DBD